MYFLYLTVIITFPTFSILLHLFCSSPHTFQIVLRTLFTLHFSLPYAWPQLKWVAKIPLTCLQRHPLGTWECHSPFLPLPPLPFSFRTESCHLRVGWGIRKGIVSSTPFYSTLFIYRHVLCWLVGADSFALVSAWSQFNSILRKWPRKKKRGEREETTKNPVCLSELSRHRTNGLQKLHFLQVLLRPNNMSCHFVSRIFWLVLPTLSTFAYKTRSLHILKEQGSNFGHWWNINFE